MAFACHIVQKPACGKFGFRVPSACILSIEVVQLNDHVSALTPLSTLALIALTDDFGAALPSDTNDLRKA